MPAVAAFFLSHFNILNQFPLRGNWLKRGGFRSSVCPFRYCVSVTIGAGGPMVGKAHPLGPKAPQGAKPPLEKGGASPPRISSITKYLTLPYLT